MKDYIRAFLEAIKIGKAAIKEIRKVKDANHTRKVLKALADFDVTKLNKHHLNRK